MKKLISLLLALAMILALSTTAFAAENTTLTINGETGRTYSGYKLLNLTTSLKCTETHDHTDGCYNYAYTVNEKYATILKAQAGEKDIIEFLSGLTSDSDSTYGSLREVADSIYRAILDAKLAPDAENLEGTSSTIGQGYWLFADVTDLDEDKAANSLVMVDTKGQDALTITPKVGLPTVEKKVKDINNSNDADITDNAWQDSADHDIGDTVPFQLTATLPENIAGYTTYKMVFHDTMSAGLTLDVDSITVTIDGVATTAFTYAAGEDGAFTLTCDNVLAIKGVTKDSVIVVTYNATLNNNAVIGAAGNPNEVYLEFSNNPYGDGTGKTETDKVIVFTYKVIVNKVNSNNQPLKGAGFTLYKHNGTDYVAIGEELVGGDMTTFTWTGLDDGDYKLVETTVPAGYNKMEDIEFTISAEHDVEAEEPALTKLDGGNLGTGAVDTGAITKDIVNNTGTILPETGAQGTLMIIAFSSMLVMAAVVFMVTRKKMSIYED